MLPDFIDSGVVQYNEHDTGDNLYSSIATGTQTFVIVYIKMFILFMLPDEIGGAYSCRFVRPSVPKIVRSITPK